MQQVSGLSVSVYGSSAVVFGGKQRHGLCYLDLLSLEWHVEACVGTLPPPTLFHAAAVYDRYLLVCGGLSLAEAAEEGGMSRAATGSSIPYRSMKPLRVYRLDLAQLEWQLVEPTGTLPTDRSHHTVAMSGNSLVMMGGKPIGQAFTAQQLQTFERVHFFDAFVLDLKANVWRRVDFSTSEVPLPRLWGHAMCCVEGGGGAAFLLHGGIEVDIWETASDNGTDNDGLPAAQLNDSVHVLNIDTRTCTVFPARPEELAPPARLAHCALMRGRTELLVIGGLVVSPITSSLAPCLEMWTWSPNSGTWRPAPFCYDDVHAPPPPPYPFSKFPAVVYGETLVVIGTDMDTVHLYDGSRWSRMEATATSCFVSNEAADRNPEAIGTVDSRGEPVFVHPFHWRNLLPSAAQNHRESVAGSNNSAESERSDALKGEVDDEVHALRGLVRSAMHAAQSPKPMQRAGSERLRSDDVVQRSEQTLQGIARKLTSRGHPSSISPAMASYFAALDVSAGGSNQNVLLPSVDLRAVHPADIRAFLDKEREALYQRFNAKQPPL